MLHLKHIRENLSVRASRTGAALGVAGALVAWSALTYGGFVRRDFLPAPTDVLEALRYLHFDQALVRSAAASFMRVTVGFIVSAAVAYPLGLVMGTWPRVRVVVWPVLAPLRNVPIAGVVPLTILWFQITETQKVAALFLGSFFYLLAGVVEAVENVEETYLHLGYTLGAGPLTTLFKVIIPASAPAVADAFRVMYGIGWTYILVAEAVSAEYGLGALTIAAQRRNHTDQVFALIAVILVIGYVSDSLFRRLNEWLFPWRKV